MNARVYALHFSDDIVKVGRTEHLDKRVNQHAYDARARQATITAQWSFEVDNAVNAERWLCRWASRTLANAWGSEYFRATADQYVDLVELALSELPNLDLSVTPERFDPPAADPEWSSRWTAYIEWWFPRLPDSPSLGMTYQQRCAGAPSLAASSSP